MSPVHVSRRAFVAGASALGAAVVVGGVVASLDDDAREWVPLHDLVADPEGCRAVGLAAATVLASPDPSAVATAVGARRIGDNWCVRPTAFREAAPDREAGDFAADRVAVVDGWLLSRTSLEVAYLVAFPPGPEG